MSIYFIQAGKNGPIKIGYTNNGVNERLNQLQTACPYELKLLWVYEGETYTESEVQESLRHEHIRGEWFHPGKDVFEKIKELCITTEIDLINQDDAGVTIFENFDGSVEISLHGGIRRAFFNKDGSILIIDDFNDKAIRISDDMKKIESLEL